jgi:hypothetical protein
VNNIPKNCSPGITQTTLLNRPVICRSSLRNNRKQTENFN